MTRRVAILGMAARFAGADDVGAFWDVLAGGGSGLRTLEPAVLGDLGRRAAPPPGEGGLCTVGLLRDPAAFDPRPFGLTAAEARRLGVRPRLLLQAAWHAIEDAGIDPTRLRRRRVSVFVGAMRAADEDDSGFLLANRLSHVLGFTGASQTVDAAHASALAALHQARAALLADECDFAVVAAVAYDFAFWQVTPPGVVSPTGRCRVFAADADGVVPAEGVGALLLARADAAEAAGGRPRAWLLGTAVGHAGNRSTLGEPSFDSQAETLRSALAAAGVSASAVGYVEAHGTGTVAGDPVEVAALRSVLADGRRAPLVGSAKAAIGHAEAAAGLAGLIKTITVLERRRVPGQPGVDALNPLLGIDDGSLRIPLAEVRLPASTAVRAVVAALGYGGVAAYAVLAPAQPPRRPKAAAVASPLPFVLSAATDAALAGLAGRWHGWLAGTPSSDRPPLAEVCATVCLGRTAMARRIGGLVGGWADVERLLNSFGGTATEDGSAPGLLFDGGADSAADLRLARVLVEAGAVSGPVAATAGGVAALLAFAAMGPDDHGNPRERPAVAVIDPATGRTLGPRSFAGLVAEAQAWPRPGEAIRARWRDLHAAIDADRALAAWTSVLDEAPSGDGLLRDVALLDALKGHLCRWRLPVGGGADDGPEAALLAAVAAGLPRRVLARALAGDTDATAEAEAAVALLPLPRLPADRLYEIGDGDAWRAAAARAGAPAAGRWIALSEVREKGVAAFLLRRWAAGAAVDLAAAFEDVRGRSHGLPLYPFEVEDVGGIAPRPAGPQAIAAEEDPVRRYVKAVIGGVVGVPAAEIPDAAGLAESCGVDSYANQEIVARLEKDLGPLPPTLLFSHGTVTALAAYLAEAVPEALGRVAGADTAPLPQAPCDAPSPRRVPAAPKHREPVAVVGLGGKFPGAPDKDAFWRMLLDGVEHIAEVPADRWDWRPWQGERGAGDGRIYTRWGGFIEGADLFDPLFFNLSPAQAALMDPQQRLFLQAAWSAIEDAGHTRASLSRATGVFVGASTQTYALLAAQLSRSGAAVPVETDLSDIANRVSYFLDLHGPSLTVDTACSASLTAVHLALRSLHVGESAAAIVGGVNLTLHPNRIAQFCGKGMLAAEARCHPFGEGADGFVDGEGACALLLKPLSAAHADGDHVYGLLRGSAVNSGGRTSGYTVPDPAAQAALVRAALDDAGVSAATVGYVECHGTGTRLGDPIEIEGLTQAFRVDTERTGFCAIGSLKANIGHLIGAAGIAGLAKTLLQLDHGMLAPSINADPPNSRIDFAATPFTVNRAARPWPQLAVERAGIAVAVPRRAGVSSFGSGGSNAHVVVEEAPVAAPAGRAGRERPQAVPLSARTPDELAARVGQLVGWLDTHDVALADLAHTLRVGREAMKHRMAVVASDLAGLRKALTDWRADGQPCDETDREIATATKAWRKGRDVDWSRFYDPRAFRRVSLPAYPFGRMRCWLPEADLTETPIATATSAPDPLRGMVHVPAWSPAPLRVGPDTTAPKRVLVVSGAGDGGIGEAISRRHAGAEILTAADGRPVDRIYFLAGAMVNPPADIFDTAAMSAETERGVLALFRLVKAVMEKGGTPPHLIVVTGDVHPIGGDGARNPWHAALHGFCKSLAKERAGWRVSCLDVDLAAANAAPGGTDGLAEAIVAEPADARGDETVLRGGVRYRRVLRPVELPAGTAAPYRDGGVYLIVGGAGGIGAAFSRFLAERHHARLVWIGRRPIDAAVEAGLAGVRAAGGDALYLAGDAADVRVIRRAAALAKEKFGGLDGAVHSAVVLRDHALIRMSEADFVDGLTAKTGVAAAMLAALRDEPLDFMVFFSSALSMVGFAGQANYTAGCAVKDALAQSLHGRLPWPVVSLNWGYWRDVGIVANETYAGILASEGILSIPTADALDAVGRVLAAGVRQAIPMKATNDLLVALGREPSPTLRSVPGSRIAADPAAAARRTPDTRVAADWNGARRRLEALAPALVRRAFAALGWKGGDPGTDIEALRRRLGVVDAHRRLFAALVRIARDDAADTGDSLERIAAEVPQAAGLVRLLDAATAAMPDVLAGRRSATEALFPNGTMDLVEPFYTGNPEADWCNERTVDAVLAIVEARIAAVPDGRRITIVEIGAGTGGRSRCLLARLAPLADRLRYIYTDISNAFTDYGRRHFAADFPFVEFRVADAERHPSEQGFIPGEADVVVGTNVLHATRDMRRTLSHAKALLAGGGWLAANEITAATRFTTLTFGLLAGWWLFEDEVERLPDAPLLAWPTWRRLLSEQGFRRTALIGGLAEADEPAIQNVFIAESDGLVPITAWVPAPVAVQVGSDAIAASPAAAAPSTPSDSLSTVLDVVAEALKLPLEAIDPDASFRDYGVDSITGVAVVRKLNQRLGTEMPVTVIFDHPSARALAAMAAGTVTPKAAPRVAAREPSAAAVGSAADLAAIREALAKTLAIPVDAVAPDSDVQDLGLDLVAAQAAARQISDRLGRRVAPALLFESRTPSAVAIAISGTPSRPATARQSRLPRRAEAEEAIAVIGMAGRYPGARDLDAFWDAVAGGRECVTVVPPERWDGEAWYDPDPARLDRTHCKWGGFLSDVDMFDPAFFGLSFREACLMDPQQRLFLEACWKALADGGYQRAALEGTRCGVFAGVGEADYLALMEEAGVLRPGPTFWGNSISALPARIAYLLDLRGPALAIDTACSSSLVAIHEACRSVANGECDVALAGGAHVRLTPRFHIAASNAGMLSPSGRSAAFDDSADGFVPGEGVGAVLLKRLDAALADGDRVHGVIRGSAINQDGRTNGLTAPSVRAQTDVELAAWSAGGIDPATISYVEAHGTGTPLGDPVEIAGLTAAFRAHTDRRQFCAIGSVKTNIGHAAMAAGIAGLTKVLLMMRHRKIPPSLHFRTANRHIDFAASPFRVATDLADWRPEAGGLTAAVSSFGMSGTNAHVVVEQAPEGAMGSRPPVAMPEMNLRRCWFDLATEGTFSAPLPATAGDAAEAAVRRALVRAEIADVLGMSPVAIDDDGDLAAQGLSPVRADALRRRLAARFAVRLSADAGAATLDGWIAALEGAPAAGGDADKAAVQAAARRLRDGLVRADALNGERRQVDAGRSGTDDRIWGGAE